LLPSNKQEKRLSQNFLELVEAIQELNPSNQRVQRRAQLAYKYLRNLIQ
jgi:hypothetical protein